MIQEAAETSVHGAVPIPCPGPPAPREGITRRRPARREDGVVNDAGASEEAALVERFRASGDGQAFDQLYRRHRRSVLAVCQHYLSEPAAAEDACHDAFVRAWQRSDSLHGEAFLPWVRRIAVNICLNRIRHLAVGRRLAPELAGRSSVAAGSEQRTIARQELELCAHIVRELPPGQRLVFLLRHSEGLKPREITESTGYSAEQVRSHLQNARRNFRLAWERLQGEGGERDG